ncbi:hypothetical protein PAHAL_5G276100 [Panicum hallii]|uniref:Protein kinase domain-containing protein n=1 Tax=Panicum hallii TaxID=206008 RepID=A0A2T8ILG3_9POAL|nr:hypothetical protein PAHAL_5G276100 [Panicum hallii]
MNCRTNVLRVIITVHSAIWICATHSLVRVFLLYSICFERTGLRGSIPRYLPPQTLLYLSPTWTCSLLSLLRRRSTSLPLLRRRSLQFLFSFATASILRSLPHLYLLRHRSTSLPLLRYGSLSSLLLRRRSFSPSLPHLRLLRHRSTSLFSGTVPSNSYLLLRWRPLPPPLPPHLCLLRPAPPLSLFTGAVPSNSSLLLRRRTFSTRLPSAPLSSPTPFPPPIPFSCSAFKVLDFERTNSDLNNIMHEAQTIILMDQPNVVMAHCSFTKDQTLWVIMPYMAGGSCLHIMKSVHPTGFEEAVIAIVLREVLRGLEYFHHHGHIHRDVKTFFLHMFISGYFQSIRIAPEVMEQLHGCDFNRHMVLWNYCT